MSNRSMHAKVLEFFEMFSSHHGVFDTPQLRCTCGAECVHPIGVDVNAGGQITSVTNRGTTMRAGKAAGRGVQIDMRFACEEGGHIFTVRFQFHKGTTQLSHERGDRISDDMDTISTIWRD